MHGGYTGAARLLGQVCGGREGVVHHAQDQHNRLACAASLSIEGKFMVACGRTAATSPFFLSSDGMRS
jgi:hypothetical protein